MSLCLAGRAVEFLGATMGIDLLHLRRLLQLLYASERQLPALLKADIRAEIAKADGLASSGGDFYGPFWYDVREHVFERGDLRSLALERIAKSKSRERLYPVLTNGFLRWWETQRRLTNAPFEQVASPTKILKINDILSVKIEDILSIRDGLGVDRHIYPYFYESPSLKNEAGRIGLRILQRAFPALSLENFRLLDIPRGRVFAPDRSFLEGDEDIILQRRFYQVWEMYVALEERH